MVDINREIKDEVIALRRQYNIKLPDAIIAATALYLNMPLFSADGIFHKIQKLKFIKYEDTI